MKFYFKTRIVKIVLIIYIFQFVLSNNTRETEKSGEDYSNYNNNENEGEETDIWGKTFILFN